MGENLAGVITRLRLGGRAALESGRPGGSADAVAERLRVQAADQRARVRAYARAASWRRGLLRAGLTAGGVGGALAVLGQPLGPALVTGALAGVGRWLWWWRTLPARRAGPTPEAAAWATGAEGERRTARVLRRLTDHGWAVLHDRGVPGSASNVDHVVIGPTGLFVIDSKLWRGRAVTVVDDVCYVGGWPLDTATTRWEAAHVFDVLLDELALAGTGVVPVICLHDAWVRRGGYHVDGVDIVGAGELVNYLQRGGPGLLDQPAVERLAAAVAARLADALARERETSEARRG